MTLQSNSLPNSSSKSSNLSSFIFALDWQRISRFTLFWVLAGSFVVTAKLLIAPLMVPSLPQSVPAAGLGVGPMAEPMAEPMAGPIELEVDPALDNCTAIGARICLSE